MGAEVDPASKSATVTQLLRRLREGDHEAYDQLFPIVYRHLHSLGQVQRTRWRGEHSLNTTGLVHELYIKLSGQQAPDWRDRSHFMAVASTAMRQILIDRSRRRRAERRGGGARVLRLDDIQEALSSDPRLTSERVDAFLALEESLERLHKESPRQHRIVECRLFGGMTIRQTAEALRISTAAVTRGWSMARTWLYRDLKHSLSHPG